jgi:hypothetical protein
MILKSNRQTQAHFLHRHTKQRGVSFIKHVQILVVISVSLFHQQLQNYREKEHENAQGCTVFHNMWCLVLSQSTRPPVNLYVSGPEGQVWVQSVHCVSSVCTLSISLSLPASVPVTGEEISFCLQITVHLNHYAKAVLMLCLVPEVSSSKSCLGLRWTKMNCTEQPLQM